MKTLTTPVFCAIDTASLEHACALAEALVPLGLGLKVGMEFVNAFGPQGIEKLCEASPDAPLFIDLKFHDIPNTVAAAVRTLSSYFKPAYINVHASGGRAMMEAAKTACAAPTRLLGVTVLTSMDDAALRDVGQHDVASQVERLALLAGDCGLDGVVCSAHEIKTLRTACGKDFVLMVPGIRPAGAAADDQVRVMTPPQAMKAGATHLVIGRPITQADDPAQAARDILKTISN